MRRLIAVLAVSALVAACSDQPTQPDAGQPQFAKWGAANGSWTYRWPGACGVWGWDGSPIDELYPVKGAYNQNSVFSWQCWVEGRIPNPTGRAIHFGPDNVPQYVIDVWTWVFGVYTGSGPVPLCDIDLRRYPTGYDVFPVPDAMKPNIQCTWNWHYTISASGEARLTAIFAGNSWYPFR